MRRVMLWVIGVLLVVRGQDLHAMRDADVSLYAPPFQVGGLKFTVPSKWQSEAVENPSRAGQWHLALSHGQEGESGEVVLFYFGSGIGGTTKENIEAWIGTMFNAEGHPAAAEVKHHEINGLKISQVVIFGTYNQPVFMPGIPPQPKPNYGLLGAVIESPKGNIYWRMTGPESLVTANLPLFNKVIDSVKQEDK